MICKRGAPHKTSLVSSCLASISMLTKKTSNGIQQHSLSSFQHTLPAPPPRTYILVLSPPEQTSCMFIFYPIVLLMSDCEGVHE